MSEMKMTEDSTSYKIWPFQSDAVSVYGDRNNGGKSGADHRDRSVMAGVVNDELR